MRDVGVKNVEMSLHGALPATHDAVMQRPGAFDRLKRAVKLVRNVGLPVTLKNVVMQQNYRELSAMARIAHEWDAGFSANAIICPAEDGDSSPQRWMMDPDEDVEIDYSVIAGAMGLEPGTGKPGPAILTCRAGRTVCGITPEGSILPCIAFRREVGSVRRRSFQEIWHEHPDPFLVELREMRDQDVRECFSCDLRSACIRCPGVAFMETGDARLPSVSACRVARLLHRARRQAEGAV